MQDRGRRVRAPNRWCRAARASVDALGWNGLRHSGALGVGTTWVDPQQRGAAYAARRQRIVVRRETGNHGAPPDDDHSDSQAVIRSAGVGSSVHIPIANHAGECHLPSCGPGCGTGNGQDQLSLKSLPYRAPPWVISNQRVSCAGEAPQTANASPMRDHRRHSSRPAIFPDSKLY